jgi:hypothetical protein
MSTQSESEEGERRSRWSIFMDLVSTALGSFLIVYAIATAMKASFDQGGQQDLPQGNKNAT